MASLNLYATTIPLFLRSLKSLDKILSKAETHAQQTSTPHSKLLETRLYTDMAPLPYQIQRVSDTAKGLCVRLGSAPQNPMADTETTFEELHARIAKTITVLEGAKEEDFEGKEAKEVVMKMGQGEWKASGLEYVTQFAVPNFYFHVATAYAILRHCGVPVGKMDYLGAA
ncbi:MAG: hypothetical protein Q9164_002587 [Protoblastenia rupestris]